MPTKNLFDKPFDEGTVAKLEIFENYLDSWLPVFVMSKFDKPIQIFDLFAGAGLGLNKVEGSPLRILRIIKKYASLLRNNQKKVSLFLNDYDKTKTKTLINLCENIINANYISDIVDLKVSNNKFVDFLRANNNVLENGCNIIFVDQNGFKEVTESIFKYLINLETSEFMFFISSSYLHRFAVNSEVQKLHPKFDFKLIKSCNRKLIHNVVCREFEKYVPQNISSYSLIPFSIMKSDKVNVYGLIFVSKHVLGADKFLDVAWKMNNINGNANFDIDDDFKKVQLDIFGGKLLTKIETFQNNLEILILSKSMRNNFDIYIHTLNEGHIPRHAHDKLVSMKKAGLIDFDGKSPLVNYKNVIKNPREVEFRVIEK